NGEYYPGGTYGANDTVGPRHHPAQGTTVNLGWPTIGTGDADYLHALREVAIPVAEGLGSD
ncbi:Histone deacetylase hda1, partial [Tilletia horrida]